MAEWESNCLIPGLLLCFIFTITRVDGAIQSLNNKYSNIQKLEKYHIRRNVDIELGHLGRKVDLLTGRPIGIGTGHGGYIPCLSCSPGCECDHEGKTWRGEIRVSEGYKQVDVTNTLNNEVHHDFKSRTRRSTDADAKIVINRVLLNGTQDANQAIIHWIGKGVSEKIFVLTSKYAVINGRSTLVSSKVWRSNDYGSHFQEIDFGPGVKISYFYTFPQDEKRLLFTDVDAKKVYTTVDELDHNIPYSVPVVPDFIMPHPSKDEMLLLYSLTQRKLLVSMDFARSWNVLAENVLPNFHWGVEAYEDNQTVHMEIEGASPTQALYKRCIAPHCSNDIDQDLLGPFLADSLLVHKEYMFVQKSNANGSENYMYVSYKRGPFERAFFPGNLKSDGFMLLNLDDGQVFVAVNHGDHVNLYLSDATGRYYVLSLPNVYHILRYNWFEIDFHEMEGMNWTFLANVRAAVQGKDAGTVTTYISFDKGGNWQPLQLTEELKAQCPNPAKCSLKLHIKQNVLLRSTVSQANAPGVILSHGNLGENFQNTEISVFSSRDGGWTWKKAPFSGSYRFNILDQGSVLTAIQDGLLSENKTKIVHYSCDEGLTWKKEDFDANGVIVKGVLTEPGSLTNVESVFGNEGRSKPWTLIKLNFTNVLKRKCEKDDYESWFPSYHDSDKTKCILGVTVEYQRRDVSKPPCYNGGILVPNVKVNDTCECEAEDYECSFGYHKSNGKCIKSDWYHEGYISFECDDSGTYYQSQGYRKIPADTCVEHESEKDKYDKKKTKCPTLIPSGLTITSQSTNVRVGQPVDLYLEQAGGSKVGTKYSWNFGDGSEQLVENAFHNASHVSHIFLTSGHFVITVKAENSKGHASASLPVHAQDRLDNLIIVAPQAGKVNLPIHFDALVSSNNMPVAKHSDHVHFVWTFGDEADTSLPTLSWNSSMSHTYSSIGTYSVTVEGVNSISSLYQQISVTIHDVAAVLVLTFSNNGKYFNISNPLIGQLFMLRVQQQISEDLGVKLDRLQPVIVSTSPPTAHLYIFSPSGPGDLSIKSITETVKLQVKAGKLGVSLFGKPSENFNVIKILSATDLSSESPERSGANLKAVYIAAPILILAIIVSGVAFLYCRRKMKSIRQYNLLNTQDDSDALLDDDDDEAPLDLNIDFGIRESSRDDAMIEAGGSHLVMVTGGSSDNAETC